MITTHTTRVAAAFAVVALLTVALFPAPAVSGDHSGKLMYSEEFALKPEGKLTINVEDIDLEIKTGATAESSVEVYVKGMDKEKAEEYFGKLKFSARLDGDELIIETHKKSVNIVGFWNSIRNTRIWAVVTVPEKIDVGITTEDGDIILESIVGNASITTEDGDINLSGITGGSITIKSEDGDVRADLLDGGSVALYSEDGDMMIQSLESGDIIVKTSDGDLDIEHLSGDKIELRSEDGDMTVEHADGDDIIVRTEDGDISINAAGKRLHGECSDGDIVINLLNAMEVVLKTEDGDIIVSVPKGSGANLDLDGDRVNLKSKILIDGNVSKKHIKGTLNSGGPLIRISVDDGTIIFREK